MAMSWIRNLLCNRKDASADARRFSALFCSSWGVSCLSPQGLPLPRFGVSHTLSCAEVPPTAPHQDEGKRWQRRVVTVRGTAEERGAALGALLGEDIAELIRHRLTLYSYRGQAVWKALGVSAAPVWKEHAPVSWAEMQGMRHCAPATQFELCMLATDFEMQMGSWAEPGLLAGSEANTAIDAAPTASGRCTAFAVTDAPGPAGPGPLCGQNVDEEPSGWLDGRRDVVVRHVGDPGGSPDALVYTHPGIPAYCGMNSAGLAVMNLFIDDGARNLHGVPIDVALREVLTYRSIEKATAYLEAVPRIAPTTFMLVQGNTIVTVEASAQRIVTAYTRGPGECFHANHPMLDQRMAADCGEPGACSKHRLSYMTESVQGLLRGTHGVDEQQGFWVEEARRVLMETPPAHPTMAPTMARVIMEPELGRMHVLFRGEQHWLVMGFADESL